MSELPFMPFYDGDFRRDTVHLTFDERSAYFWLLVAMWSRDGSIPDSDADIARSMNLSLRRWKSIRARVEPFLEKLPNGNLTQKRLQSEYRKAKLKIEKLRNNGRMGGRPPLKENKDLAKPEASDLLKPGLSIARGNQQSHSHSEKKEDQKREVGQGALPVKVSPDDPVMNGSVAEWRSYYPDTIIAELAFKFDGIDVEEAISQLWDWASSKADKPNEIMRMVYGGLKKRHDLRSQAPALLAEQENPKSVAPSASLLQSKLVRANR